MAVLNITPDKLLADLKENGIKSIKIRFDYWPSENHHANPIIGRTVVKLENILKHRQEKFSKYHHCILHVEIADHNGESECFDFNYHKGNPDPFVDYKKRNYPELNKFQSRR